MRTNGVVQEERKSGGVEKAHDTEREQEKERSRQ